MAGVPELLAGAILKQVAVKLGSTIWKEIGAQLNLSEDLKDLETTFAAVKNVLRKAEKRSDGEKIVWIEELKDAAYDMEDMLTDFEHEISPGSSVSELNTPIPRISIPILAKLRIKLPGKLNDMKKRLEKIAKLKELDFTPGDQEGFHNQTARVPREEGPLLGEHIVGRTREKEEMMRLLQQDCEHSIIPIYGFGGLGKTTLARMVFEDSGNTDDFDVRVWVHVTEKFDLEKIGRSVISQAEADGPSTQYDYDYPSVQRHVEKILKDKRSLIVLDDIWEGDERNLEELRILLGVANSRNKQIVSKRSKVVLTTRSGTIAKLMNEQFQFKLDVLPDVDCWELFKAKAFPPSRNVESRVEKEEVGQKVVKKCKGFPLAVKSIGWRLRDADLKTWEMTLEIDPWLKLKETSPTGDTDTVVLDSLKQSYCNMPEYLRPCFAYFSVFPKGFVVDKKYLIQQWIALGFVDSELHAVKYLSELNDMSFLQTVNAAPSISARYSKHRNEAYQMHDFVYALATSIAGEEVAMFFDGQGRNSSSRMARCRYILLSNLAGMALKCSNMPSKARAMHFKDCRGLKLHPDIFSKAKWLRILDFSGMGTVELPESMIHLHHLQVLNLSENTSITKLRSRISNFNKLHYLDLHGCSNLRELPDSIGELKELLHLDLSKCASLRELPMSLGDLQKLLSLNLSFCYQLKTVPETFSQLTNLEELNMSGCSFNQLPTRLFKKMVNLIFLDLSSCTELAELPGSSEGLRKLQYLNLSDCSKLQNILSLLIKFVDLKYLNLSRVEGRGGIEAPGTSARGISNHSSHGLQLRELHGVLKCLTKLEYLVVGGLTLFSEQGIGGIDELITLPDFVVRQRDARCSSITLLQSIIDLTHNDLNIRCLENIGSPEEASAVGLVNRKHLHSLSLEWSLSEYDDADKDNDKVVLQNLRPNQNLKKLSVKGYMPDSFPAWIMEINQTLPNLVKIVLSDISNCTSLPPLRYLPKLEVIEICRMPMLGVVYIGPCKNLRRLSLVELPHGAIVILHDDTRGVEVPSEEQEISEPSIGNNPNKNQVSIVAKAKGLLKDAFRVLRRETDHALLLMSETPQTSLSNLPGLTQEAKAGFTMQLCLYIGACRGLVFPQGLEGLNIVELVIDNCFPFTDFSGFFWDNLQILRMINCSVTFISDFTLEIFPTFISLRELEIGFNTEVKDEFLKKKAAKNLQSLLLKMTNLEKLTYISSGVDVDTLEVPWVITEEAIRFSVQATNSHSSNISVLFQSDHPKIKTLNIRNLENIKGPEEVGEGCIYRHYQELNSLSLMWSSENIDQNVQDDSRTDMVILEKLQPPPSLSTLRLEGYWSSAVCDWMKNLSYVLPNLVRIELAMCEQLPPLRQLDHLKILTFSHCCSLVELPDQIIRGCTSLKELEISECWNLAELPEWLGDHTSLTTLIIHAAKLERLPQSIRCLTSLEKLVLKKCNYKLREWCDSGQNVDIVQHGCLDISEGPDIFMSSSSITLLQKITSPHLHELNIKDLQCVSSSEAKELKLMSKEELHSLSLEWSSLRDQVSKLDMDVLEELQPHKNLKRLRIKNYSGVEFPNWMHSLQNLVRLELSNFQTGCLCLDHLQNLEDLCISSFRILIGCEYPTDPEYNGRSHRKIVTTQTLKNLRKVTIGGVRKLVWQTSTLSNHNVESFFKILPGSTGSESSFLPTDNLFPGLEYLEIDSCPDLTFKPSIPRSARYQISGCKIDPWLFEWPSFQRVMGLSTSAASSKMEIKYSKNISSGSLDSLGQLDIEELTVDTCVDRIPLPECIQAWKSLRKLEILNCENMETLPEWLGDMSSLRELKVETCWMQTLPPCIERLTSLQSLTLSKCTKKFKQRCSAGGDDWSKINKIKNLIVEERKR